MKVCVIGVGLIGGSMAIDLKESGYATEIIGVDIKPDNLDKALRRRIIDRALPIESGIAEADIILLTVPMDAMLHLAPFVLNLVDRQTVIEVGSAKQRLLKSLEDHPQRNRMVAAHPMAGTEFSGPEAALPKLFENKSCVLVEEGATDPDAWVKGLEVFEALGMRIVQYDPAAHDLHAAYVSHISHISSFALALTVLEKEKDEKSIFAMAGGGFSSTVRLAKSSASMWAPIFEQNRDNVLDVLDEHINSLAKFRSYLIKNDFEGITELIQKANHIKKILG
ncbi:MAG: prephenate dehydrogenase [Saprospiraceae bacterium]|nr:prephenate dehydrogenase [Saprospiraceae bacterium]